MKPQKSGSQLVSKSLANGVPPKYGAELRDQVEEFSDILSIKLSENSAKVDPLRVTMDKDAKPIIQARGDTRRVAPNS